VSDPPAWLSSPHLVNRRSCSWGSVSATTSSCSWPRRADVLFLKRFDPAPGPHPDLGCNAETFTNHEMLELETLSPLVSIAPGPAATHVERWRVEAGVDFGEGEDGSWNAVTRALAKM
jgi:hypothetical protein